ncbi:MAG: OmpA family protein [Gemmatimonadetes bacterium]|nr:OmpA family protein [Gemmatimonadota bacterium]
MTLRRGALLLAGLAALAVPSRAVRAQDPGTIEVAVFGKYERLDAGMPWSKRSQVGFGGMVGYFFAENLAVEFTGAKTTGDGQEAAYSHTGLLTYHVPATENLDVHIGAGYLIHKNGFYGINGSYSYLGVPPNKGQASVWDLGARGIVGVNWWWTDQLGVRVDGTFGFIPYPKNRLGYTPNGIDVNLGVEGGLTYRLGGSKDTDKDGVSDKNDKCPNTPAGVKVDATGCPIDTDKDGVADYLDKCPNTPAGARVDSNGCPVDSDGDGVADYMDKCPNTPRGAKVDAAGCPVDTDKDGVADYMDKCPNTPAGVKVDAAGCPVDTDRDGVPDYLDKCPNTVPGTKVDATGCSIDSDSDGVADADDKCPNTPRGIKVDRTGCPVDTDGDGVSDDKDKCPNTPAGTKVDAVGCPVLFEAGKKNLTLKGVNFENAKATLLGESYSELDKVAESLVANPDVKIAVEGYTDNRGAAAANRKLSQARAEAVRNYLISKGVSADNVTAKGFGPSKPVAPNTTEAGRAQNRRVELRRTN